MQDCIRQQRDSLKTSQAFFKSNWSKKPTGLFAISSTSISSSSSLSSAALWGFSNLSYMSSIGTLPSSAMLFSCCTRHSVYLHLLHRSSSRSRFLPVLLGLRSLPGIYPSGFSASCILVWWISVRIIETWWFTIRCHFHISGHFCLITWVSVIIFLLECLMIKYTK